MTRRTLASLRTDGAAFLRAHWYLRGASLGQRVRLRGRPRVVTRGEMTIGDRVQLVSTVAQLELVAERGGHLTIGSQSLVNFGCSIVAVERVSIGERCHIGPHCMIMDTAFHELDPDRRLESPAPRPIDIAENVWIGARVIVMPGITIGAGSAVGAGSVVTHDVAPRTLVAGVPARFIREI